MKTAHVALSAALLLAAAYIPKASADENTNNKSGSSIEFIQVNDASGRAFNKYTSGTFYYHNNFNDPTQEPVTGNDKGVSFIGVKGVAPLEKFKGFGETTAWITRITRIPENAPKTIQCSFKTRVVTDPKVDTNGSTAGKSGPSLEIKFARGNFTGGVKNIDLRPSGVWNDQNITLNIPPGAEFLILKMRADLGDELDLGNWTIE